jgi:hypothetical protein
LEHKEGLIGSFIYVDDFLSALRELKARAHNIETAFSPLRLVEVQEILGKKPSNIRFVTLLGGIIGGLGTVGLAVYAHLSYNIITGGKPVLPWVPWIIVLFEGTILGAAVFSAAAWIIRGRLPRLSPADGYNARFSQDRFGILVACEGNEREEVRKLLKERGAEEVHSAAW